MIIKILLMPLYIILLLFRIAVDMVLRLSAWIFYALAGLFLLTAICCYYMQIESAVGIRQMLISSGIMLILPQVVTAISAVLEVATEILGDKIKSI